MEYTDQMGRTITLAHKPRRIISIVPSQTELLFQLGLKDAIKGITWFCVHPTELFTTAEKIGGTKKLNFERIDALEPDLIIGNKEENDREQITALEKKYPVWMSDIETLEDALLMIEMLGEITGTDGKAIAMCDDIIAGFNELLPYREKVEGTRAAYLIWRNPWMGVGNNTFIHQMLTHCGFTNVFSGFVPSDFDAEAESLRYPRFNLEELQELQPEVVFLSSEPYPFKEKHITEIKDLLPCAEIRLVDGEMFSWYGSRLLHAPGYFIDLIESLQREAVHG